MKNINLILSVLLWAVCSSVFAVTLPTSSYSSYRDANSGNEEFVIGTGTSFLNYSTLGSSEAPLCNPGELKGDAADQYCESCCSDQYQTCKLMGGTGCLTLKQTCISECMGYSLPLGSPLLLLPFALVFAFVRRRRKEATL